MQTARARATAKDTRMMSALAEELDGGRPGGGGGNKNGSPRSQSHLVASVVVALIGGFVTTAGAGSGNGFVTAIGVGIMISAAVYAAYSTLQRRLASMVAGTAHVVSASTPPVAATHGRCEMHLVVQAPRLPATAVRHRDQSVPVAKWPAPGATLPVVVDPREPRELRIRWDRVTNHGAARPDADTDSPTTDKPRYDDELELLADATGVTAALPAVPAPTSPAPAGIDQLTPANADAPTSPVDEPTPPLGTLYGSPADDQVDLSFLDPPKASPDSENDPLLVEYGSPIREVGVTLIVSDIKQSLEFYRDVLGFFEIESGPDMVLLEARTGRVVLRQRDDATAKPPRLMHLTLEVNDIDTAHRTLTKRGVEFIDEPRAVLKGELLELWAVSFHDPDGHGVALTSWLPREEDA